MPTILIVAARTIRSIDSTSRDLFFQEVVPFLAGLVLSNPTTSCISRGLHRLTGVPEQHGQKQSTSPSVEMSVMPKVCSSV